MDPTHTNELAACQLVDKGKLSTIQIIGINDIV